MHHVAVACNHLPGTRRHSKLFVCYLVVEMKLSLFWIKAKKSSFPLKKWPWLWSKQTGPTTSIIEPCPSMPPSTSAAAGMGSDSFVLQFSPTHEQGISKCFDSRTLPGGAVCLLVEWVERPCHLMLYVSKFEPVPFLHCFFTLMSWVHSIFL